MAWTIIDLCSSASPMAPNSNPLLVVVVGCADVNVTATFGMSPTLWTCTKSSLLVLAGRQPTVKLSAGCCTKLGALHSRMQGATVIVSLQALPEPSDAL
jgi:hypothetical protein